MPTYKFSLLLSGIKSFDDRLVDKLFEAGCEDALLSSCDEAIYLDFTRESLSISTALTSAIRQAESVSGIKVARVFPDDLVTAAEIARRIGKSREYVRLLISGDRGGGDFPSFILETGRSKLWSWRKVSFWLSSRNFIAAEEADIAIHIEDINVYLQNRHDLVGFRRQMNKIEEQMNK